ncbi:uncharacterized protein LOC127714339 [Mytilus californianus]|uniref:uncharacterized protein LOC127714339 n=1 Tax=Mytilus californianus TaxID=6549 RepID=UPI00224824E1|nr:uncharacterized protein LOC127714339 [Mytilus californianus]
MSKMPPNESIIHSLDLGNSKTEDDDDQLIIIIGDKQKSKNVTERKHRKKKKVKDMWENEDFIQIKGIQKAQEVVNKNLRQLQLDKMRISRKEASENIRRRREMTQQKQVLKEVLQKMKGRGDLFNYERNLNEENSFNSDKENKLINNKNTTSTQSKENNNVSYLDKRLIHNDNNKTDILPPLVRTTRKPNLSMASERKSPVSTSSADNIIPSDTKQKKPVYGAHKRSIVVTIPDVNTDASLYTQRSVRRFTKSASSDRRSVKSDSATQCDKEEEITPNRTNHPSSARSRLTDLPPIKFTLQGLNGPPVSYYVEKGNMVSYRPSYGVPTSKLPDEKTTNPTMVVSPRNSSVSIPLVRKEACRPKDNLSIVGKNPQIPLSQHFFETEEPPAFVGRVSSYDIRSSVSPDSSGGSSRTSPRHSMRGSKLLRKKPKETSVKKELQYTTATGFVISEFSMQDRVPKKQNVKVEKQSVHEFPVHVRERYIKKKLLIAQSDRQDAVSWKVRKYITDPGSFSSAMSKDFSSPAALSTEIGNRSSKDHDSSIPQNKRDISDLLLRLLLKQNPRNHVQRERTVPSDDKILSSFNSTKSKHERSHDRVIEKIKENKLS